MLPLGSTYKKREELRGKLVPVVVNAAKRPGVARPLPLPRTRRRAAQSCAGLREGSRAGASGVPAKQWQQGKWGP